MVRIAMNDEIASLKRKQLEERTRVRDQGSESILKTLGLDEFDDESSYSLTLNDKSGMEISLESKPVCKTCNGRGWVKTLFSKIECDACFGTKLDLTDPLFVIRWQSMCLRWAKKEILKYREFLSNTMLDKATIEEKVIEDFYKNARRKD